MSMEDELCLDTPYVHDLMCDWEDENSECVCAFIGRVRANERARYRSFTIGLMTRSDRG